MSVRSSGAIAVFVWLLGAASPLSAVVVSRVSSPVLAIDPNHGLTGTYVGFRIVNTDPVSYSDIWVTLADFEGGVVGLAPFASDRYRVGALAQGETKTAYFYLSASEETAIGQTHSLLAGSLQEPQHHITCSVLSPLINE